MCFGEYSLKAHMDKFRPESFLPADAGRVRDPARPCRWRAPRLSASCRKSNAGRAARSRCMPARCIARSRGCCESELIEELTEAPDPKNDDERRRYYRLTTRGIAVAQVGSRPAGGAAGGRSLAATAERCPDVMRRLFSLALFAYPRAFRRRFGDEMYDDFRRRPLGHGLHGTHTGDACDQRPR